MQTVKLDFPDRDLYILADGDWRGYRSHPCAKEPETVEWIRSFPEGSVLWDVGASVGPYSLIAAALGHEVVAFEPFYPSLGHLQQNVWLNEGSGLPSVVVMPFALASEEFSFFQVIQDTNPGAASHRMDVGGRLQRFACISADSAMGMLKYPDHVKIDVDGAELGVIEGGRETWKQVDSIMVESEPPTVDNITVILADAGLELVESWPRLGETKQRNYLYRRSGK